MIVRRVDVTDANRDKEEHDCNLNRNDDRVDGSRLTRTFDEQRGDEKNDRRSGQVGYAGNGIPMAVLPRLGDIPDVKRVQNIGEITRPADAHGGGAKRILEHEGPSDDPSEELAEGGVGIGIRTPRDWDFA